MDLGDTVGIRKKINGKDPYELKLFDPKSYIGRPRDSNNLNVRNVLDLKRMEKRNQGAKYTPNLSQAGS